MNTGVADLDEVKNYLQIFKENSINFLLSLDKWYLEFNLKRHPSLSYVEGSDWLNVYLFPREIGYFKPEAIKPGKWFELESSVVSKEVEDKIKDFCGDSSNKLPGYKELITDEFLKKSGKLVLFSLGTIVTRTIDVFKQIIPLLAGINHKFIVCKGKFGDQIDLPANCVGANMIDQLELLQHVDLFVTHGGNGFSK